MAEQQQFYAEQPQGFEQTMQFQPLGFDMQQTQFTQPQFIQPPPMTTGSFAMNPMPFVFYPTMDDFEANAQPSAAPAAYGAEQVYGGESFEAPVTVAKKKKKSGWLCSLCS